MPLSNSTGDIPLGGNLDNYGYDPSLIMTVIFLTLYTLSSTLHVFQTYMKNSPRFMIISAVGGYIEALGWAGRLWSHFAQFASGYMMQIVCIVIAPTFMSAALYVLLAVVIALADQDKSVLSPKMFKAVFITADVFSLVLQAAGGGLAATSNGNQSQGTMGSNIMLAVIVIQLVVMVGFVAYGSWWAYRASATLRAEDRDISLQLVGIFICSIAIIIRGCYRTGELSQGFSGTIADTQLLFLLDGIPITVAMITLNVFHPGRLLKGTHLSLPTATGSRSSLDAEKAVGSVSQWSAVMVEAGPSRFSKLAAKVKGLRA